MTQRREDFDYQRDRDYDRDHSRESGDRLEHRLTKLESGMGNLQSQVANAEQAITSRLDYSNGKIAHHFEEDAKWQREHGEVHIRAEATAAGFKKGQMAVLGVIAAVAPVVSALAMKLVFK